MTSGKWRIETPTPLTRPGWMAMRSALWPEMTEEDNLTETGKLETGKLDAEAKAFVRIALNTEGKPVGFAEATLRTDYVNGCETSPVAFLEGIYVEPRARRQGVAKELVAEVERWALGHGCREFASDAFLDNEASHRMHRGLGFMETERVVYFRKDLTP
jgi:aminoglycoside 6'-N-acetyltransferase I